MKFIALLIATGAAVAAATSTEQLRARDISDAYDIIARFDSETGTLLPRDDFEVLKGGGGGKGGGKKPPKGGKGNGGATSKCGPCQDCLSNCQGLEGEFADSGCTLGCSTSKTCKGC